MNHNVRIVGLGALAIVVLFGLIQLIPYGQSHTNPTVVQEPQWDSPDTRALAVRACFDCHSNQTNWNVWSDIAPFSWLIQNDVDGGRRVLNFSEWNQNQRSARNMAESVQRGTMPRWFYLPIHPEANLSAAERQQLITGLQAISAGSGN
jgi:Haem-binding domain